MQSLVTKYADPEFIKSCPELLRKPVEYDDKHKRERESENTRFNEYLNKAHSRFIPFAKEMAEKEGKVLAICLNLIVDNKNSKPRRVMRMFAYPVYVNGEMYYVMPAYKELAGFTDTQGRTVNIHKDNRNMIVTKSFMLFMMMSRFVMETRCKNHLNEIEEHNPMTCFGFSMPRITSNLFSPMDSNKTLGSDILFYEKLHNNMKNLVFEENTTKDYRPDKKIITYVFLTPEQHKTVCYGNINVILGWLYAEIPVISTYFNVMGYPYTEKDISEFPLGATEILYKHPPGKRKYENLDFDDDMNKKQNTGHVERAVASEGRTEICLKNNQFDININVHAINFHNLGPLLQDTDLCRATQMLTEQIYNKHSYAVPKNVDSPVEPVSVAELYNIVNQSYESGPEPEPIGDSQINYFYFENNNILPLEENENHENKYPCPDTPAFPLHPNNMMFAANAILHGDTVRWQIFDLDNILTNSF